MTTLHRVLTKTSEAVDSIVRKFAILLIVALVAVITLQILMREVNYALSWTDEVSRFLLVYLSMFGAALAYNRGTHISVRLFQDRLPERAAWAVETVIHLLSVVFFALLIEYGIVLIMRQRYQVSGAVRMPMQYIYLCIPMSMATMIIFSLTKITGNLARLFGGRADS